MIAEHFLWYCIPNSQAAAGSGARYVIRSFAGISPNPIVDLPCSPEEVLDGIEAVILSHFHVDHVDPLAQQMLSKDIPVFCQAGDENRIADLGFSNVRPIDQAATWSGITISRTPGRHGSGALAEQMGPVSGFFFQSAVEIR